MFAEMSVASRAVRGSSGCVGGHYEPEEVSFPLSPAFKIPAGGITEMPLSTSGLLVLAAPDGCPQGSLQLNINIKPPPLRGG